MTAECSRSLQAGELPAVRKKFNAIPMFMKSDNSGVHTHIPEIHSLQGYRKTAQWDSATHHTNTGPSEECHCRETDTTLVDFSNFRF